MITTEQLTKACQDVEAKIAKQLHGWVGRQHRELHDMTNALVISYMEQAEETLWQSISMIHAVTKAEAARGPVAVMKQAAQAARGPQTVSELAEYMTGEGAKGYQKPRPTGIKLVRGARLILIALAQAGKPRTAAYVGAAAELSSKSGTFGTYLGMLRSQGLVEGSGDALCITPAGIEALGDYEPLPTGEALVERWCQKVGGGAARILRCLAKAYPNAFTAEQVGAMADISHTSGTFGTYIGKLRTLCLIEKRIPFKATDELMGGT